MKTLLIEGWRGVSHSIALVNQYQLLVMLGDAAQTVEKLIALVR